MTEALGLVHMRVVQINLQPDYGGAENYTLMLSEELRKLGHIVTVLRSEWLAGWLVEKGTIA
jgi:hypothetical protein